MMEHRDYEPKIRDTIVNGIFYPDEPEELETNLQELFRKAGTSPGAALGIISPHAGFNYSGVFAASAFLAASERKNIASVVILAPIHRDPEVGVFLPESDFFDTPLGRIPVDRSAVEALANSSTLFVKNDIPHLEEHGVEIQLPFIRYLFPAASIVPLLIGDLSSSGVGGLADALTLTFRDRYAETLFVVSANLTNYMDFQLGMNEADRLLELILSKDVESMLAAHSAGRLSSCGVNGIAALLSLENRGLEPELLSRGDSSAGNGDRKNGVHYASLAFRFGGENG
jgi:AmmeMemoRadiSam system protein B